MQAMEFEAWIDETGRILVPERFQGTYGKRARLVVLLPDQSDAVRKRRQPGSAKGMLSLLSEDDEHLNDMNGYMP